MNKITVLISDDHAIVREGLRLLLGTSPDIEVLGEVENGRQAVAEAQRLRPAVVLLDLSMPEMNGLEAARQIIKRVPTAKILILSAHSDDHYVQEAIEAGTAGYLMKESVGKDLLLAIREVARGNAFFSPPVAKRLLKQCQETFMNGGGIKPKGNKLTSRQTEVLQLIAEGHSNKEMADKLSLSIKTVEKHRQTLMDKLDLHDVALLTRYAISMGITESNVKITMV